MSDLEDKYKKKDRLPILVSDEDSVKLLGAPALPTKSSELSGDLMSSQVPFLRTGTARSKYVAWFSTQQHQTPVT